jgi:hypothetical protein
MAISDILESIDREIAQLQQARTLLGGGTKPAAKNATDRLKKVAAAPKKATVVAPAAEKPAKSRGDTSLPRGESGSPRPSKSAGRRRRLLKRSSEPPYNGAFVRRRTKSAQSAALVSSSGQSGG